LFLIDFPLERICPATESVLKKSHIPFDPTKNDSCKGISSVESAR
jgi:hypothetical protein